ncbi:hypothetical protein Trydic_g4757 [Trypoxylus dichotomus]
MEEILLEWIEDNNPKRIGINAITILTKAELLYDSLSNSGEVSANKQNFNASKPWFDRFKQRHKLHNIKFTREVAGAIENAARLSARLQSRSKYSMPIRPGCIGNVCPLEHSYHKKSDEPLDLKPSKIDIRFFSVVMLLAI